MSWRNWIGALAGATAVVMAASAASPARAAQGHLALRAPYTSSGHSSYMTCAPKDVAPACSASVGVDRRSGTMTVSSGVDSGLHGTLPGTPTSEADAWISQPVAIGDATAATFTARVHVSRNAQTSEGMGRAYTLTWGTASCDHCSNPPGSYAFPDGPADQTFSFTLIRSPGGAHTALLTVQTAATTNVECEDFCVTPRGVARASAEVSLRGVDLKLWGLGVPTTPTVSEPKQLEVVTPAVYDRSCDPDCGPFTGERITGTAEPGMPISLSEGPRTVGGAVTDESGNWTAYVNLAAGPQSLVATANGPEGKAVSSPRTVTVAG